MAKLHFGDHVRLVPNAQLIIDWHRERTDWIKETLLKPEKTYQVSETRHKVHIRDQEQHVRLWGVRYNLSNPWFPESCFMLVE